MQKISRPLSSSLRNLSYNRKKQELDKIFSSSNAKYGIDLLIELGLDEVLEIYNLKDVKLNCDLLGIWATLSVSPKYEFTSNEKGIIKDIETGKEEETTLPKSNVLYYDLEEDAWCCVRPSGTEPKIKFYMGVKGTSMEDAENKLNILTDFMKKLANQ